MNSTAGPVGDVHLQFGFAAHSVFMSYY